MPCKRIFAPLVFAASLSVAPSIMAQTAIPSGTILPISLDTGLNAAKVHPGERIRATVMQDVPGTSIRRRAKVVGQVVDAGASRNGGTQLKIRFDGVYVHGGLVPFQANLRALASLLEVEEAQIPEEMSSRGLTPATWTTQQIGGDQFYRGGGPVARGVTTVGQVTPWGALDLPRTQPGMPCRGAIGENHGPQAMWLFSSDACGVYGFANIRIEHAGRTDPQGAIILVSDNGKLKLGSGTGLLLRAFSPAALSASGADAELTHE
jgi:hypothetical protein